MNIEKFQRLLRDPARSKNDLMVMRKNAIQNNAIEHIHAAENALNERFPGWMAVRTHGGGGEPTYVEFKGQKDICDSAKDAYLWLVQRFLLHDPDLLEKDWSVFNRNKGVLFSRTLKELFNGYKSGIQSHMHYKLSNGWLAKTNISNDQKLDGLIYLSVLAGLQFGKDWDWKDVSKEELGI